MSGSDLAKVPRYHTEMKRITDVQPQALRLPIRRTCVPHFLSRLFLTWYLSNKVSRVEALRSIVLQLLVS
jgi:hypothetical protein